MGYTHYFRFSQRKAADIKDGDKKFKEAIALFRKGLKKLPDLKLGDGLGKGEPVITDERLCFNGKGEDGYETFNLVLNEPMEGLNTFCKTARRPYDVAVCLALLCFKKAFGNDFTYSSDGNSPMSRKLYEIGAGMDEGWANACEIMSEIR